MDHGTLARPIESVYPSNLSNRIRRSSIAFAMVLKVEKHQRQARRPLNQEASRLEDLREFDPQVLSEIHEKYFTEIFRYVRYRVSDQARAEDIASETFLRLLDAVDAKKGPRRSIRGWLFGTASNLINDHFRKQYREDELLIEDLAQPSRIGTSDKLDHLEQQELLGSAVGQLTEDQQHVIALRFGSGLTIEETAQVMQKNQNAVKGLQYRAIRALRKEFEVEE